MRFLDLQFAFVIVFILTCFAVIFSFHDSNKMTIAIQVDTVSTLSFGSNNHDMV